MDEELDPDGGTVNSVLAQESSELFSILTSQLPTVILKLCKMMPEGPGWNTGHVALCTSSAAFTEPIKAMLEYFKTASAAECRDFLQTVCMLCENIPMHLESRLMSVAGYANTDGIQTAARETVYPTTTDRCQSSSPSVTDESAPPSEQQRIKRPRIDYWQQYITAATKLVKRRWELLSKHLVREVQLENVWISLRMSSKGRDRPDQTPGRSRTSEPDGDVESLETLDTFLQGCTGKLIVIAGWAGSGKTLLMSCLGQQWAHGLGPVPSSYLFIVLEFRQLNLLSGLLSLADLLFRHYLPPEGDEDEKRAIVDYLLSNPEQSCWVLDGYDEFNSRLTKQDVQYNLLDPETPLTVADLMSGLLHQQLLPGCTVLVTCRLRDVVDLEEISFKVGQLLGWGHQEIKEYVDNFFRAQGDPAIQDLGMQATNLILSNRHLLAMSSLPALCNICCICVKHLLLEDKEGAAGVQSAVREEEEGRLSRKEENTKERKGVQTNGRAQLPSNTGQIPLTLTQVYLTVLTAFLSLYPGKGGAPDEAKSTVGQLDLLSHYRAELCELTQLAWSGLEKHKILFLEDEISHNVLELSVGTGLFSQVECRREDGMLVNAYSFIHLTIQEFLAALRIMSSKDVNDTQLKNRFSLKTRWTTKSDQKTVFTDSFHLYVCGLASSHCTPALVQLARASFGTGAQSWVQKRQALVLKLLNKKCQSNTLTGPKILELCHCIQESQDNQLAKQFVGTRATLELRNIPLSPNDIDALAFVVSSVGDSGIGLDFGACSMEPECLDVLSKCRNINCLSFRSRKYGDKFAEKLSFVLPKFTTLRKLEFCGASVTATGAASLTSALQSCQEIEEINLSDNNLRDEGIRLIADIFNSLPKLAVVMLGRNHSSLQALDYLVGKMSQCLHIKHVHADGMKEVKITFYPHSDVYSNKKKSEPTVSLLNQKWSTPEMQMLANSLACCPALSVLDLSGGLWDVEILRTLTQFLPKFHVSKYIQLNDSCSSVDALVVLTALLSHCPAVVDLHIRLRSSTGPRQVSIVFSGKTEKPAVKMTKALCLKCCGLLPADLDRVWQSLGTSSDLTVLDLSSNCLGNKGLMTLLNILPRLHNIQEINFSNNGISMKGVFTLAGALCSCNSLIHIHIRDEDQKQVLLKFSPGISYDKQQLKLFRINNSPLQPSDITSLCNQLAQCDSSLELDLSHSSLNDKAVKNLLELLPKMESLRKLNVSHSITSTTGAIMLVSSFTVHQRVTSVELSPQSDSFVRFDSVKAEQASCRLTHFHLNCNDVKLLLEIFHQGPRLSDLDLSSNQLDDEGAKCLVDLLPGLQITSYINLSNNRLSQQGLLDVASTLSAFGNTSGADISLGPEKRCLIWFRQYENCEKTLSVTEGSLKPEHLVRLAEIVASCSTPVKLLLKDNSLQAEWIQDFVKMLNSGWSGCSVSISEDWIRAEEAVHLVCSCLGLNKNILALRVRQTTLQVSLPSVSTSSAEPNSSPITEKIGLVDCAVQGYQLDRMRSIIQKCPLLTELDFSHISLGVEGAEFLCSVLPLLPNLTSLSIGSKETCPDVLDKLAEVLVQSTTIQNLNVSGHVIGDTAAQIMTRMFPRLLSLNLSHCKGSASARLQLSEALQQCVRLEGLCLDLYEDNAVFLAQALRKNKSIRSLRLNRIPIEMGPPGVNGVLDVLAATDGLTQVENVELESWRMAEGVEQLTRLLPVWTKLRKISLSKNRISDQSGDKLLDALISCSRLEELHLSSNSLGDLTAARMALVLPSLTHMSVLDISENNIGCEGSVSLSKAIMCMKQLTKINLTSVGTSELCPVAASLAHCPLIQDVSLGWNNCDDNVALELARVLPSCQKLTRIDLESNRVSAVGVEALVKPAQSCPALQLIRLWRNNVCPFEAQRLSNMDRRLNFSPT